jgi:hypothetical protein
MAVFLQLVPQCDEGLYVAATTHDLDDNVEFDMPFPPFQKAICRHVGWRERNNARKGFPELGIEIKVNAAVLCVLW